jgi:hypothetical protein
LPGSRCTRCTPDSNLSFEYTARALDHERDLFEAADLVLGRVDLLDLPALRLGVARVHPIEVGREQPGLVAAGARPDLDDDVLVVVGVRRQHHDLEFVFERLLALLELGELLAGELAHLGIALGAHDLLGVRDVIEHADVCRDRVGERRHARVLLGEAGVRLLIGEDLGVAEPLGELAVTPEDRVESVAHGEVCPYVLRVCGS